MTDTPHPATTRPATTPLAMAFMARSPWIGAALALCLLSACAEGPRAWHRLSTIDGAPPGGEALDIQLSVSEPEALADLDTAAIAIVDARGAITYLDGKVWGDRLPAMFQAALADSLGAAGFLKAVTVGGSAMLATTHRLGGTLRAFEIRLGGAQPVAHVVYAAILSDIKTGEALATRRFESLHGAAGLADADLIEALDTASGAVIADIADWAYRALARRGHQGAGRPGGTGAR